MYIQQHSRSKTGRLAFRLDQPRTMSIAVWLVPLIFGLLSIKLGQDANWDLLNYHLYNPFAFFNNKLGVDLAPAQMQTYFNPTIDFLYYGMVQVLPGPLVSFTMGVLHGLNFVLLLVIARALLPAASDGARILLPILLALAGMGSNAFLSELGNTMGDNLVALAVLGALAMLLHFWPRLIDGGGWMILLGAGFLMGLGVGLKLTAAVFAPALCVSLLALPVRPVLRVRAALLFGIGVLIGIALAGGHWYWKMWVMFGNPLFPQFNSLFHSPMAGPMALGDTRFLPHGLIEYLLWPFIFVLDPVRVSEIKIASPIWALLYFMGAALLLKKLLRYGATQPAPHATIPMPDKKITVLAIFFVISYVTWMMLFSIYRYLVPLELLAPLVLWLVAKSLLPRVVAGKIVLVLLIGVVASNFFPRANWGYAPLANAYLKADVPVFATPSQSIVFTLHHHAPLGWLITQFPKELAFVSLDSNFPESDAYRARIAAMMAARSGPMYAMYDVRGAQPDSSLNEQQLAKSLTKDRAMLAGAIETLSSRNLVLDPASCITRPAYIGNLLHPYRMCQVRRKKP